MMLRRLFCIAAIAALGASGLSAQDREVRLPERPAHRGAYTDYSVKEQGYWTAIEAAGGSSALFHRRNLQPISVSWINGIRMSEYLRFGLGIGAKYYINGSDVLRSDDEWRFPLYLDVRGNFISQQDREAVPYWSIDAGAELRGGMFASPTLGYRFGTPRGSVLLGLSFCVFTADTWKKDNELLSSWSLRFGYEF